MSYRPALFVRPASQVGTVGREVGRENGPLIRTTSGEIAGGKSRIPFQLFYRLLCPPYSAFCQRGNAVLIAKQRPAHGVRAAGTALLRPGGLERGQKRAGSGACPEKYPGLCRD
ncbi:MAG: hypothetical protein D3906_18435, partial [Candidatus Electrothrix sp. AUS1_2]|nr:hypothetical protein [Candidatus Electrothrix sp. AUS1_2]